MINAVATFTLIIRVYISVTVIYLVSFTVAMNKKFFLRFFCSQSITPDHTNNDGTFVGGKLLKIRVEGAWYWNLVHALQTLEMIMMVVLTGFGLSKGAICLLMNLI